MRHFARLAILLTAVPVLASAQYASDDPNTFPPPSEASPPAELPAPPQAAPPQPATAPPGQWVSTSQYGWLWIPYDRQYVYIAPDAQAFPEEYVYYPVYGWRWVVAPWVYGYGPQPFWGSAGLRGFAWYSHPWFRVGGYWGWGAYRGWGNYRGWVGPRTWGARGWAAAPAYYRTGVGYRREVRPAPAARHEHSRGEHWRHER
jgi:hypothetical protein